MSKSRFLQILVFLLALIFLGIGIFYYIRTDRNLYTAIFLRTGAICFLFGCFWSQIQKLPRWTDIGWLPLIAVAVSWKTALLRYAIPVSFILIFLNSPLGRGKYRRKSWRKIRGNFMNRQSHPLEKAASCDSDVSSAEESLNETGAQDLSEKTARETSVSEPTSNSDAFQKEERPRQEKKTAASNVRGPGARNVMFRAMSRVAGRQVGKWMNNEKKK